MQLYYCLYCHILNNMQHSDELLWGQIKTGNEQAFTELYNRYYTMLLMNAFDKTGNYQDAQDIVQEAFEIVWQKKEILDINTSVKGYLFKIVSNQFSNRLRKSKSAPKIIDINAYTAEDTICEIPLERKELGVQLQQAINDISAPAQRTAFILHYIDNKSHQQVASEMRIEQQVARNQVSRALKFLRSRLKKNIY